MVVLQVSRSTPIKTGHRVLYCLLKDLDQNFLGCMDGLDVSRPRDKGFSLQRFESLTAGAQRSTINKLRPVFFDMRTCNSAP